MSDVFSSIAESVDVFVYRCKNDENYTMESIEGSIRPLTGYDARDILGNRVASWVGITYHEDVERVFGIVDAAVEKNEPWDLPYRIVHRDGHPVWVRERGCAMFEDGELTHLQGLIVGAQAETRLRNELEDVVARTRKSNEEILGLASQITDSVKKVTLLSVNARIEAARSGEAGAGFAVIANEINDLAKGNSKIAGIITEKLQGGETPGERQQEAGISTDKAAAVRETEAL